jgi:hypothetical protein
MTIRIPQVVALVLAVLAYPVVTRAEHLPGSHGRATTRTAPEGAPVGTQRADPCKTGNCGLVYGGRGGRGSSFRGGPNLRLGMGLRRGGSSWKRRGRGGRGYGRSGRGRRGFRRRR